MKKHLVISAALALLLLMAACAQSGPAGTPAPTPTPTPTPDQTVTDLAPPDRLPWDLPAGEPTYDEYFAKWLDYGYGSDSYYTTVPRGWELMNGYQAMCEDGVLFVRSSATGERLWNVAEVENFRVLCCRRDWIYGVQDGTDLVRIDYFGKTRETVFTDSTGLLGQLNGQLWVADGKVAYLWAGTEGGVGLYRMYLPECRADLLRTIPREELEKLYFSGYTGTQKNEEMYHLGDLFPVSNQECVWDRGNGAFYQLYASLLNDPDRRAQYFPDGIDGEPERCYEVLGQITSAFLNWPWVSCYYSAADDTYLEKNYSSNSSDIGTSAWWEDGKTGLLADVAVDLDALDLHGEAGIALPLVYESDDSIIFWGIFGLFGYDLKADEITFSVDFKKLYNDPDTQPSVQGSIITMVKASADGTKLVIHYGDPDRLELGEQPCHIDVTAGTWRFGEKAPAGVEYIYHSWDDRVGELIPGIEVCDTRYILDGKTWIPFKLDTSPLSGLRPKELTPDTAVGIGWRIEYISDDYLIFRTENYLFGYDLKARRMDFSLNLLDLVGAGAFQGSDPSNTAVVKVVPNRRLVQIYRADGKSDVYFLNTWDGAYYTAPRQEWEWPDAVDPSSYGPNMGSISTASTQGTGSLSQLYFQRGVQTWQLFDGYFD